MDEGHRHLKNAVQACNLMALLSGMLTGDLAGHATGTDWGKAAIWLDKHAEQRRKDREQKRCPECDGRGFVAQQLQEESDG
jgi:hypothetical protein